MKLPFAVYRDYEKQLHIIDADTRTVLSDNFAYDRTPDEAEIRMDLLAKALNSGWAKAEANNGKTMKPHFAVEKNMAGRILTCVYCGHEYPQDTPAHGSEVLTEHIKLCERHPMRKAENDIAMLRSALAGLIGADTETELRQIGVIIQRLPAPDDTATAVTVNAINALLATMPKI